MKHGLSISFSVFFFLFKFNNSNLNLSYLLVKGIISLYQSSYAHVGHFSHIINNKG